MRGFMMSTRKKDETIGFLENLLLPDVSEMTREEVDRALREEGIDVEEYQKRIASGVREIAKRERREGRSAPAYLRDVIEQLDPFSGLPVGIRSATQKAKSWIDQISGRLSPPADPILLASYRKSDKELTEGDRDLLDKEKEALLERMKNDDQTK
jgi:hypothetical protein